MVTPKAVSASAVFVATNQPADVREFLMNFGLTQSGTKVGWKCR